MVQKRYSYNEIENLALLEQLYEQYLKDPKSIGPSWQSFFSNLEKDTEGKNNSNLEISSKSSNIENISSNLSETLDPEKMIRPLSPAPSEEEAPYQIKPKIDDKGLRISQVIDHYRRYGFLEAQISAFNTYKGQNFENISHLFSFIKAEFTEPFPTLGCMQQTQGTLNIILQHLQQTYCDKIGFEYMGIHSAELEVWLQQKIEPYQGKPQISDSYKKDILKALNRAELFENFLHTKYTGQKRFSLEGCESLIPMLQSLVEHGIQHGITKVVFGMAHRGRLNTLAHVFGKNYSEIFQEFEGKELLEPYATVGDVKYHKGFSVQYTNQKGGQIDLQLLPNPSHLESNYPVVEGFARALQDLAGKEQSSKSIIPVLVHGDAALSGQGVVYETLQLQRLDGYGTGGTIHIVINNHIGFTTSPAEARSTRYCTDIARVFQAPILHVNSNDPESCIHSIQLAMDIRQNFQCDVFIELNGYRKRGHNELEDPLLNQPLYYKKIKNSLSSKQLYNSYLLEKNIISVNYLEELELEFKRNLQHCFNEIKELKSAGERVYRSKGNQKAIKNLTSCTNKVIHNHNLDTLKSIGYTLIDCPVSFIIHEKLEKLLKTRSMSLNTNIAYKGVDWGFAEQLALGCILLKGISVRLSGQDVQTGTFNQRHAVWKDQETGLPYVPLNNLAKKQGIFTVWNSPLAEYAVLGFEFGYSVGNPDSLTIWEAQYGDFSNGAQIIIDQWISTAQHKWGLLSKLVILLPHGYEGQGAEHSSARIERFLQSAADDNWCIAIPTTPAQYFHLLIRQALTANQKPLVVFTPKGLLRDSTCMSSLKELNEEVFQEVLCDVEATNGSIIKDVIICCGKIYYDLIKEKEERLATQVAIIRIEQLYPFNGDILKEMLTLFKNMQRCIWVQEEPQNMGAWSFIAPLIQSLLPFEIKLQYVGRVASNVTAVGSYDRHKAEQSQVIAQAFSGNYVNLYQIQHEIPI